MGCWIVSSLECVEHWKQSLKAKVSWIPNGINQGFYFLDRKTKLCLYVAWYVVFLDVKKQFHIQENYRYWMMMTGFDSCIRQHPMWPSYEELIDHLPSMKNWTQWQKLSDTMILSWNPLLFTLKVWTRQKERERGQKGIKLLTKGPCKIHDICDRISQWFLAFPTYK